MESSANNVYRVLDANFNRAREGLRVMEDYARFVLDDGALTADLKEARHELAACLRRLEGARRDPEGMRALVEARDIVGDVGAELTTPAESRRESAESVATAAGKRVSEALRSLEEFGKTVDADFAAGIEKLRYRGYELERRIALAVRAKERFGAVKLYVLLTASLCRHDWMATAAAVLRGGADAIQLREKALPDAELLARAAKLAMLCRERGAMLIINDRPDVAVACGADGVHVGQEDLPVAAVRHVVPARFVVGVSTHTSAQVREAAAQAPDYIAVGPMFDSPTKPQPHVAGPATLGEARRITSVPLVAIGGITRANAESVLATAPVCLCVCQDIIAQDEPEARTRAFRVLLDRPLAAAS